MDYKRSWARVDLNAVSSNVNVIRQSIGADVKLMAVVKADGYGHGAARVADAALGSGADCVGVAICEEGISLRENGITAPVLILGYTPGSLLGEAIRRNLTLTVFDYETAVKISEAAADLGKRAVIHIKLETGMNRLGFDFGKKSVEIIEKIYRDPWIFVEGIFTHFAKADSWDLSFTYEQAHIFDAFLDILEVRGVHIPVKHAANSAATLRCPDLSYDMVRVGIVMYGLRPSEDIGLCGYDLRPALSLMSQISHVKKIDAGEIVGYGGTFITVRETVVATVPLGYADGYSRALSNRAYVLVRGCKAPVIGKICMDQFMLDITDVKMASDIRQGELVTLIGHDGGAEISADDIAEWRGTINYEVVAGISKRVPRIYSR